MIKLLQMLGFEPTWDAQVWLKKWSTWLAVVQAALGAATLAWVALDADMRAAIPVIIPKVTGIATLAIAFITPILTNATQRKLPTPETTNEKVQALPDTESKDAPC
jgi:hypothetical protein